MLTSTILIGSQTNAMRAQKCLNSVSIQSDIIKSTTDKTRGCVFGLRVPTERIRAALQALEGCNIKYEY